MVVEDGAPGFRVCDPRLLKIYPVPESSDDKRACSLNWINTRNRFSAHIAHKLLQCQRDYWLSGREADLRPLGLQQFLALYPLDHLDASRLSRLLARLWVLTPRHELICLRRLFPSRKRVAALRIKELISQSPRCLKDREVQSALARQGTDLSCAPLQLPQGAEHPQSQRAAERLLRHGRGLWRITATGREEI